MATNEKVGLEKMLRKSKCMFMCVSQTECGTKS